MISFSEANFCYFGRHGFQTDPKQLTQQNSNVIFLACFYIFTNS